MKNMGWKSWQFSLAVGRGRSLALLCYYVIIMCKKAPANATARRPLGRSRREALVKGTPIRSIYFLLLSLLNASRHLTAFNFPIIELRAGPHA